MKKIMFIVFLAAVSHLQAQKQYVLKGDVSKVKETVTKVYLSYYFNGTSTQDSALVVNGKYELKGTLVEPTLANLRASYKLDTASTVSYTHLTLPTKRIV